MTQKTWCFHWVTYFNWSCLFHIIFYPFPCDASWYILVSLQMVVSRLEFKMNFCGFKQCCLRTMHFNHNPLVGPAGFKRSKEMQLWKSTSQRFTCKVTTLIYLSEDRVLMLQRLVRRWQLNVCKQSSEGGTLNRELMLSMQI